MSIQAYHKPPSFRAPFKAQFNGPKLKKKTQSELAEDRNRDWDIEVERLSFKGKPSKFFELDKYEGFDTDDSFDKKMLVPNQS